MFQAQLKLAMASQLQVLLRLLLIFVSHKLCTANDLKTCYSEPSGVQLCGPLPPRVCLWRQGLLEHGISTGPSQEDCEFVVLDADFFDVIGKKPKVEFLKSAPAHEGGVYFPDNEEFYFSSTWTLKDLPGKPANLMKMSLKTGEVAAVMKTRMANGMALDNNGELVMCEQGLFSERGYISRVNLRTLKSTIVADNWLGFSFNSPNDVIVKSDDSIWFTDPSYGQTELFKPTAKVNNQVYRVSREGVVTAVADGFAMPNGLAFSPDEKLLYVSDTGTSVGDGTWDITKPHSISVFDVDGASLRNRRVFASVAVLDGSHPAIGIPDGIKVDTAGRVYTANQDGIQVFSQEGKLLGVIRVPGAVNMGFVGHELSHMIVMNNSAIYSVQLNVRAAGLAYAQAYLHL